MQEIGSTLVARESKPSTKAGLALPMLAERIRLKTTRNSLALYRLSSCLLCMTVVLVLGPAVRLLHWMWKPLLFCEVEKLARTLQDQRKKVSQNVLQSPQADAPRKHDPIFFWSAICLGKLVGIS